MNTQQGHGYFAECQKQTDVTLQIPQQHLELSNE